MQKLLASADYRIFNLEVPLTDIKSPMEKCGPALIAPTRTIGGIKAMNPSLLCLANNHILDQGENGLASTTRLLNEQHIPYMGIGGDLHSAHTPYIIENNGVKVGIYNCAENEFTIATDKTAGANPFDSFESLDHIAQLKSKVDYVIVIYHGGKEYYRYPSPYLQKACRKMVDKGADLVVCQHSHCIGCEEKYQKSTIVYGQGNFLFDYSESEFCQTSLLLDVEINGEMHVSYIPLVKVENKVRIAKETALKIMEAFALRNEEIKQDGFIDKKYTAFAETMLNQYLFAFSGIKRSFAFKVINKLSDHRFSRWIVRRKYNKNQLLGLQNYIECEAHRELVLKGIMDRF